MNKEKFRFEISSDLEYEKLVVNLVYGTEIIATLNCDNGLDQSEISFYEKFSDNINWTFNCQEFIDALTLALRKLKENNST